MTAATGPGPSPAATVRSLTQAHKWWASKVGPLLATAFLGLLVHPVPVGDALGRLGVLVASACLLASAAYVVNDWYDRDVDRAAGKASVTMDLGGPAVLALVAGLVALGTLPWLALGLPAPAWAALAAIVVLPLVYSAPPLRWKERGGLGLVTDAGLAHVAPTVFALSAFGVGGHLDRPGVAAVAAGAAAWSLAAGLRRIIGHELVDREADRAVGVRTWVVQAGEVRARRVASRVVLPVEALALAVVVAGLATVAPLPAGTFVAIGALLLLARLLGSWEAPLPAVPSAQDERAVLYSFLHFWPGLVLAAGLAVRDGAYVLVVALYLGLFAPVAGRALAGLGIAARETASLAVKGTAGLLRYRVGTFVTGTVPRWLRYRVWEFLTGTVPNVLRYRVGTFLIGTVPNWWRHRAWVWIRHRVPNWFRYRLPEHLKRLRRALSAPGRHLRR